MTEMPPGFRDYIIKNRIRLDEDDTELRKILPHAVDGVDLKENNIVDITKWCNENFIDRDYCLTSRHDTFYFEFAADAMAFKLRWI